MKKESRTTYKVGTIGEFAAWTKRVARNPKSARNVSKKWFDSEGTANRALAEQVSPEALAKLLSPGNLAVLGVIRRKQPASVRELATLTGRTEASLSRTLKRFSQLGIVSIQEGPRRTRVPALIATHVHLEIDLSGQRSTVALHTSQERQARG